MFPFLHDPLKVHSESSIEQRYACATKMVHVNNRARPFRNDPAKDTSVQAVADFLGLGRSAKVGNLPLLERTYRSEEHTSELQSQSNLVCRLLLEKKKKKKQTYDTVNDLYNSNDSAYQ